MKMELAKSFVAERTVIDLSKPSLRGLSYVLRHSETWPKGFKWYYGDCSSCAIGLACKVWTRIGLHDPHNMRNAFWISVGEYLWIFCADYGCPHGSDVTPEMVADGIDAVLARKAP